MKIKRIYLYRLRNYEHSQFCEEVRSLIIREGAEKLKIAGLTGEFEQLCEKENTVIGRITKSAYTEQIRNADKARDDIYKGMVKINAGCLKHYKPEVRDAAIHLNILFRTYGYVPRKRLYEQSAAVTNILQELNGDYAEYAALVGISGWVAELDARNNAFMELMRKRVNEIAANVGIASSEARAKVDAAYFAICECINVFVIVEGLAAYENFIKSLNAIIAKYALLYKHKSKISTLPPCP